MLGKFVDKRRRSKCKDWGGSQINQHKRKKSRCKDCEPKEHLTDGVRSQVRKALQSDKKRSSQDYLGSDIATFKAHLESQFKEGMSWDNNGDCHIDHWMPLRYKLGRKTPTLEEVTQRLHYTNTNPLWASENVANGNKYVS